MPHNPTRGNGERLTEWLFASMMVGWGAYLILPIDTFAGPQYALLAAIAPENVWGAFSLAIGMIRLTALWVNGSWKRTPAFRLAGSMFGVSWWLTMTYLFLSGPEHHVPAGVVFYPIFVAFEGISCWRSSVDAFHSGAFKATKGARGAI